MTTMLKSVSISGGGKYNRADPATTEGQLFYASTYIYVLPNIPIGIFVFFGAN